MAAKGGVGEPPSHSPAPPAAGQTVRAFLVPKAGARERVFEPGAYHHSFKHY
jgi:hypothetical protein